MKGFDTLHVKSAIQSRHKDSSVRTHLTTLDFGQISILFHEELVPGDDISITGNIFSRTAPLYKPTYAKADVRVLSGFVPYYQIASDADAYMSGKTIDRGSLVYHRYFTGEELYSLFVQPSPIGQTVIQAEVGDYDFKSESVYYKFTPFGRYVYKVMTSLGYQLPPMYGSSFDYWTNTGKNQRYSAYPFLAFVKMYNDWMSQSQRFNSSVLSNLLDAICKNKQINVTSHDNGFSSSFGYDGNGAISGITARYMIWCLRLCYDNDYFTSAWESPNMALNASESIGAGSALQIPVPAHANGEAVYQAPKDTVITSTSPGQFNTNLGQRALDFLRAFDNWVRRNNYSGSRSVQQIYSRFGIKTDDYRSHFAYNLGKSSYPVQVGDVTSTGVGDELVLGDYAGKAIVNGSDNVSYKSSDFGLFMQLAWIQPEPVYYDGFERMVLRNSPLDYFNPEFDGVGVDAISVQEVSAPLKLSGDVYADASEFPNSVFGFTERYNSYRSGPRNQITGDYRLFDELKAWHFGRDLSKLIENTELYAQNPSMNTHPTPGSVSEYDRIFNVTDNSADHFFITAHYAVDMVRPMKSLNEAANLGVGDTVVPRNGNVVS